MHDCVHVYAHFFFPFGTFQHRCWNALSPATSLTQFQHYDVSRHAVVKVDAVQLASGRVGGLGVWVFLSGGQIKIVGGLSHVEKKEVGNDDVNGKWFIRHSGPGRTSLPFPHRYSSSPHTAMLTYHQPASTRPPSGSGYFEPVMPPMWVTLPALLNVCQRLYISPYTHWCNNSDTRRRLCVCVAAWRRGCWGERSTRGKLQVSQQAFCVLLQPFSRRQQSGGQEAQRHTKTQCAHKGNVLQHWINIAHSIHWMISFCRASLVTLTGSLLPPADPTEKSTSSQPNCYQSDVCLLQVKDCSSSLKSAIQASEIVRGSEVTAAWRSCAEFREYSGRSRDKWHDIFLQGDLARVWIAAPEGNSLTVYQQGEVSHRPITTQHQPALTGFVGL